MPTSVIIMLCITAVVVSFTIFLYFQGKKSEKKKAEQEEMIQKTSQSVSMLIIDKRRMKLKDSGLPEEAIGQAPFYAKGAKMPIVKAKVGPKIMTFICDPEIYENIPVKKEVKATVSGLYIVSVRGLHGKAEAAAPKKGIKAWFAKKMKNNN